MSRTTTTPQMLAGTAAVTPATSALDPDNGHAIPAARLDRLLLVLANAGGEAITATFAAGPGPRGGLGSLALDVPAGQAIVAGPFEGARFTQPGGALHLDLTPGATGTIAAYVLPRSA